MPSQRYRDQTQVELDVRRLNLNKAAAAKLSKRIGKLLHANKELHYYQGFHDIAQHTVSYKQLEQLAFNYLRDFMAADFQPTTQMLELVPELLAAADPEFAVLTTAGSPEMLRQGLFALSPLITLFSHTCTDSQVITAIINKVLKHGIAYIVYLYTALCLEYKPGQSDGTDALYSQLSQIGSLLTSDNFASLDVQTKKLRQLHPLTTLPSFRQISQYSVLKTGVLTKRSTVLYSVEHVTHRNLSKHLLHSGAVLVLAAFGVLTLSAVYKLRR